MTTHYVPSPLHQGSRSRTGDQVDLQLVNDLLALLGDCRLLWLPNLTDTTTSTERSRHAATITWSESLAAFDATRTRLGSGAAVDFNGTDEEGDIPDDARYSFGDGAVDQPFSVIALVNPDVVDAAQAFVTKCDDTTASTKREWRLYIDASGNHLFRIADESAGAWIGRQGSGLNAATWVLLGATYDGSGASTGIRLYEDAAQADTADSNSGSYAAVEETASLLRIGFRQGSAAAADLFNGKMGLVAVTAKCLTVHEMWAVKELVNGYFGLSL